MNYRHLFHAGNFADVFKHVVLTALLRALHRKDTPLCYMETHAGSGRYDLRDLAAQRAPEYRDGIERLWHAAPKAAAVADYLSSVRALNPDNVLRLYPGSPRIARHWLRAQDRMVLCERHPEEFARLRAEFAGDRQVALHERDGYELAKALLPPKERRGVVLIDPPYENESEFRDVLAALDAAHQRWPTGIYAVWYPVKDRARVAAFHERVRQRPWRKVLNVELMVFPEDTAFRLNGCGVTIVQPPWKLDETLREAMPELKTALGRSPQSGASVEWLIAEQ